MPTMRLTQTAAAAGVRSYELTMAEYTPIEAAPMPPTVATALAMCAVHTSSTRGKRCWNTSTQQQRTDEWR
jgi:hypothetical protein